MIRGQPGEPAIVVRPGHLPRSTVNLPEVPQREPEQSGNVVRLAARRDGAMASALGGLAVDADSRPAFAPSEPKRRALWAGVVLCSALLHASLYALLSERPKPLASAGVKSINVELWIGADSVAGMATKPSEIEAQAAPAETQSTSAETLQPDTVPARQPATQTAQRVPPAEQAAAPVARLAQAKPAAETTANAAPSSEVSSTAPTDPIKALLADAQSQKASAKVVEADRAANAAPAVQTAEQASPERAMRASVQAGPSAASLQRPASAAAVQTATSTPAVQNAAKPATPQGATETKAAANRGPANAGEAHPGEAHLVAAAAAKRVVSESPATAVAAPGKSVVETDSAAAEAVAPPATARPISRGRPAAQQPVETVWSREGAATARPADSVPAEPLSALAARAATAVPAAKATAPLPDRVAKTEPQADRATSPAEQPPLPLHAPKRRRAAAAPTHRRHADRPPSRVASAAANGIGHGRSDANSNYAGLVATQLARHKHFPEDAWQRGEQGTVIVSFVVDGSGNATSIRVAHGSGSASIDREAQAMVYRASPFPAPPGRLAMRITAPITFQIQ